MIKKRKYNSFRSIQFQKALLRWYKSQKRDLPWRKTKDPYKILISEIMLQQTQVETVIPYYKAWIKRFSTIKKLATASVDEALMLWEGMGYYSRAKNLHLAAREIVKNYNCKVPRSYEDLLRLPGIGKYTAGAIASIAFSEPVPAIDANVTRVLSRLFCISSASSSKDKTFWEIALNLMGNTSPSEFNQAMMEIGALVCIAKNPRCPNCPVRAYCKAYLKGAQSRYPEAKKPKKIEEIEVVLGIIFNKSLIYIQKRPPRGLFAGLWEFPGGKIEIGESPVKALQREIKEELGKKVRIISHEKPIRHNYTRFKVLLHPFICSVQKRFSPIPGKREYLWISQDELKKYAFPAANRKIIKTLMKEDSFA